MRENLSEERKKFEQATGYILKYAGEIQMHFNLSDKELKKVLKAAHSNIGKENTIKNSTNVLQLFYTKFGTTDDHKKNSLGAD